MPRSPGSALAGTGVASARSSTTLFTLGQADPDRQWDGARRRGGNSRRCGRRRAPGWCHRRRAWSTLWNSRLSWSMTMRTRSAAYAPGIVDVDDEGHARERFLDLGGDGAAGFGVGPVDLGQQGRQHRRAGRRLHHLDRRTVRHGETAKTLGAGRARSRGWSAARSPLGFRLTWTSPMLRFSARR